MRDSEARTCPVCGNEYTGAPALSRADNETEICPLCGLREAIENYYDSRDRLFEALKGCGPVTYVPPEN